MNNLENLSIEERTYISKKLYKTPLDCLTLIRLNKNKTVVTCEDNVLPETVKLKVNDLLEACQFNADLEALTESIGQELTHPYSWGDVFEIMASKHREEASMLCTLCYWALYHLDVYNGRTIETSAYEAQFKKNWESSC